MNNSTTNTPILDDDAITEANCKAAIRKLQDAAWNCGTDEYRDGVSETACNRRYDAMVSARAECVSAVDALCATVRALRERDAGYARVLNDRLREMEALGTAFDELHAKNDELQTQLEQVTKERDAERKDHQLTIDTFRQQEKIWQQKHDEFISDAVKLCRDKATEWAKQSEEAQARGIQIVADGKASRALAAKELATELEQLK